ncbi:MAG: MerR family transcriptional regulator [Lachnospiraceae bacterium]|nr:MerR family transcriptional regulator [Lachnospiraceae bacterium]
MNTYTIRELSERYHIPASTLRYYEDIGLLTQVNRTPSGQRIYTDEHLRRLDGIHCFKNTGLPIAKIQQFYQYESNVSENIDNIISLVTEHEENTKLHILKMQHVLLHIQQKVAYYNAVRKAISLGQKIPDWNDINA